MIRFRFLDLDIGNIRFNHKCGASTFSVIDTVLGGVSTLAGIGSSIAGSEYNYDMLRLQQQENEKNRQFQSQEAEKERAFSSVQMNQLLDYNSAPKQVQRLREAGINPATSFSNGAGSAGSAMSPTRGAVPVGSSGLQIPSFISPMSEISASGAYLKSLADAYKASEEGSKARDLLQSEIEKNMADRNLKDLQAEGQNTANMIAAKTGMRKAEAEIKYILNDADLKIALAAESIAKKGLTEAETNREIEKLTGDVYDNVRKRFEALLGKKRYQMAEIDLRYHEAEVREGIRTLQSQQAKNYSEASNAREEARFKAFDNDMRKKFNSEIANNYLQDLAAKNAISDEQYYRAKMLVRSIKYGEEHDKDVDNFLRWLSDAIGFSASIKN